MRIAALTNVELDPSLGSGKTVLMWSAGMRQLGHEVTVLAPEHFHHPWPGGKGRRLKMRLDALRVKWILLAGNYDLVEFYGAEFGPLMNRLARIPRARRPLLVAHTNGLELVAKAVPGGGANTPRLQRWAARAVEPMMNRWDVMAFARADAFAAICQADADYVVDQRLQPAERCTVVEPGVDEAFLAADWQHAKRPWILSLGSWTARKDPSTITRVVSTLLAESPEREFQVIGAASSRDEILEAFDPAVRSRVVVYPRLDQSGMIEVMTQAKVLLFPSLYEGFGMATTEAMACGCAVVVTPTGFGASIREGVDGLVCGFGDVDSMLIRCRNLLEDEALRQRIATAGRHRIGALSWANQTADLESVYRRWLQTL